MTQSFSLFDNGWIYSKWYMIMPESDALGIAITKKPGSNHYNLEFSYLKTYYRRPSFLWNSWFFILFKNFLKSRQIHDKLMRLEFTLHLVPIDLLQAAVCSCFRTSIRTYVVRIIIEESDTKEHFRFKLINLFIAWDSGESLKEDYFYVFISQLRD